MKRALISLAVLGLVSGCVAISPEDRVRDKLIGAGLKPDLAECMAGRLVRKLSSAELRDLNRLSKIPGKDPGRMSIDELADRLQALNDPHIVEVVTRSGLGCAILG